MSLLKRFVFILYFIVALFGCKRHGDINIEFLGEWDFYEQCATSNLSHGLYIHDGFGSTVLVRGLNGLGVDIEMDITGDYATIPYQTIYFSTFPEHYIDVYGTGEISDGVLRIDYNINETQDGFTIYSDFCYGEGIRP